MEIKLIIVCLAIDARAPLTANGACQAAHKKSAELVYCVDWTGQTYFRIICGGQQITYVGTHSLCTVAAVPPFHRTL